MKRTVIITCLYFHAVALAQEPIDNTILPAVEISAHGEPDSAINRSTTLDREVLSSSRKHDFNELLRGQPGVTLQAPGKSSLSPVWIRGTSSGLGQFTLDGIPLFSAVSGSFNLSALLPAAMEKVEILRGPAAARYGSPAFGGVIRLFSREAQHSGGFIQAEGGSFATLSETVGLDFSHHLGQLALTASHDDVFEGYSQADPANGNTERDGMRASQGLLRFSAEPNKQLTLDGTLFYTRSRLDQDGPGILPNGRLGTMDDLNAFAVDETWMAQGTAETVLTPQWQSSLQLGFTRYDRHGQIRNKAFGFISRLLLATWNNTFRLLDEPASQRYLALRWGMDARQEQGENLFDYPNHALHGTRTHLAGFAEFQYRVKTWQGYLGARTDYYDNFGMQPTLNGGLSWQATSTMKLRASGGTVYRAPSFHERFFIPLFGNPLLNTEQGWQTDFGLDWTPSQSSRLAITGFYSQYQSLIQLVFNPLNQAQIGTENIGHARIQGVEVEGSYAWDNGLKLGADYTYTDSDNLDDHRRLPLHPRHQGRCYGEYRFMFLPLSLWAEAVYRDSHFDESANLLKEHGAVYVNAQIGYRFKPELFLYVRGENLTNDHTPQLYSFGTRGAGVFGGVRWEFR